MRVKQVVTRRNVLDTFLQRNKKKKSLQQIMQLRTDTIAPALKPCRTIFFFLNDQNKHV